MFAFFQGASLRIAKNLIKVTGLKESLAVFRENNFSNIGMSEVLRQLIAVDACNLLQTMGEDFIARELQKDSLLEILDDYVVENLKAQPSIPCRDGAERMQQCLEIMDIVEKYQEYWFNPETQDPGPRFYCVKDLLRRLGCEANAPIRDNLLMFVYEQHNKFIHYFRTLLEPFQEEEVPPAAVSAPAPVFEAPPGPAFAPVAVNSPEPESVPVATSPVPVSSGEAAPVPDSPTAVSAPAIPKPAVIPPAASALPSLTEVEVSTPGVPTTSPETTPVSKPPVEKKAVSSGAIGALPEKNLLINPKAEIPQAVNSPSSEDMHRAPEPAVHPKPLVAEPSLEEEPKPTTAVKEPAPVQVVSLEEEKPKGAVTLGKGGVLKWNNLSQDIFSDPSMPSPESKDGVSRATLLPSEEAISLKDVSAPKTDDAQNQLLKPFNKTLEDLFMKDGPPVGFPPQNIPPKLG